MAKRIKGITIELGGDTTKLDKALANINKESRNLQRELQQVEKLLKLDPTNTELLAQKQELLAKSVEQTSTKLEALRAAQEKVNKAHAANPDWKKQYLPLQKEIEETTKKMRLLQTQEEELKGKLNAGEIGVGEYDRLRRELEETIQKHKELMQAKRDLDKEFADGHIDDQQYRDFQREVIEAEATLRDLESRLKFTKDHLGDFGDAMQGAGSKLQKAGEGIESAGKVMMPLSAGVVGLGAAAVKFADDADSAFDFFAMQTESAFGTAAADVENFHGILEKIYIQNYGESYQDIADAMAVIVQNTRDFDPGNVERLTINAIALRDAFGFEVQESIRTAQMMMDQFGISGEEAFNLIAQGAQQGLDKNGDLLDSINEYSVHFQQLGFDADSMFNALLSGAENGAFSVDKVGDAFKELGIRVKDGSDTTTEAFGILGLNAEEMQAAFAKGGDDAWGALLKVEEGLLALEDPVERNTAGVSLFGTMWEDLGEKATMSALEMGDVFSDSIDTMERLKEIKYDSLGHELETLKRKVEDVGRQFGEILLPIVGNIIDKASEFADTLSGLSDEQKQTIADIAGVVAVTGPALVLIGKFTSGIGTTVSMIGKASKALGTLSAGTGGLGTAATAALGVGGTTGTGIAGMAAGLGSAAAAAAPFVVAAGLVAGSAYGIYTALSEDVIPEVDLFATGVSDATAQAVGAYVDLDNDVRQSLLNIQMSHETITEETVQNLSGKYEQMGTMIVAELRTDYAEATSVMEEFFANSTQLTASQQTEIMMQLEQHYSDEVAATNAAKTEIHQILTQASEEKRALKQEEQQRIEELNNQMRTSAVTALSETERESTLILTRIKEADGRLTAETAAEHVRILEEQRVNAIAEAELEYQERIRVAEAIRSEGGEAAQAAADKIIEEAQRQRDEAIQAAEELKTNGIDLLKQSYTDLEENIDLETGEIMTHWDKLVNWMSDAASKARDYLNDLFSWSNSLSGFDPDKWEPLEKPVPRYSKGTKNHMGGLAIVGEEGPELINLPRGSQVFPEEATRKWDDTMRKLNQVNLPPAHLLSPAAPTATTTTYHQPSIQVEVIVQGGVDGNTGRQIGNQVANELRRRGVAFIG